MTSFESSNYKIVESPASISAFISQPQNLVEILPAERIEDWKSSGDRCSFKIKGLAAIELQLSSSTSDEVVYKSLHGPFDFRLIVKINSDGHDSSVSAKFDAEVSGMMAMMLKSPMTNFLNALGESLKVRFSGD